jgi:DNA-binding winged helix-turn-helix (wHTH) protein
VREKGTVKSFDAYRLEILPAAPRLRDRLRLFRGDEELNVDQRSLEVLEQLLAHPAETLIRDDHIAQIVWQGSDGNIDPHIYALRKALDDDASDPKFIETVRGRGFRFLVEIREEVLDPDAEGASVRIHEKWDHERFLRFLNETRRGDGPDEEGDLRILSTAFSSGVPDVFTDLLEKNVRIKILFTNEALMRARNKVRKKFPPEKALKTLREQLHTLETMKEDSSRGTLEVRETDVMPCGFVAHGAHGALLGVFLATESYVRGPMIEADPDSKLWEILRTDWHELWTDAGRKSRIKRRAAD